MLTYLLQTSTCLIILYGIYHFVLAEMTFFKYNRAYLLLSMLFSLLIPLLAPLLVLPEESVPVLHWSHIGEITYTFAGDQAGTFDWTQLVINTLWTLYGGGAIIVLAKMIFGLLKIYKYYRQGEKEDFHGYKIIHTEAVHLPFSFFSGIYVSRHVPLHDHIHTILEHEETHIRQWHTVDVLWAEIVHAFFWFNPVMIFYKRALRQAHEYLADDLICRNSSVSSYTELLLSKSQTGLELALTNQFFHSQIKKRIQKMTTHKTNRSAAWKYTLVLPLLSGLVIAFSSSTVKQHIHEMVTTSHDSIPKPPLPQSPPVLHGNPVLSGDVSEIINNKEFIKVVLKTGVSKYYYFSNQSDMEEFRNFYGSLPTPPFVPIPPDPISLQSFPSPPNPPAPPAPPTPPSIDKDIFKVVEQMPRFPGCENESNEYERKNCSDKKMLEYIYAKLKYPTEAKQKSIEGSVIAQFVITKEGIVSDINIVKDISGGCGQAVIEMLQTMNDMPEKWVPGKQAGRNVNVLYTLPVKFRLSGDQETKTEASFDKNTPNKKIDVSTIMDSGSKFEMKTDSDVRLRITGDETTEDIGFLKGDMILVKNDKVLKEDVDYSVDYKTGKLSILHQKLLEEKGAFNVSFTNRKKKKNSNDLFVKVYPNPTSDQIELSLTGSKEDVEVSILDMAGKLLYKNKFDNRQEHFYTKIDISQINVPTILVKTVQGNKVSANQLVIRK